MWQNDVMFIFLQNPLLLWNKPIKAKLQPSWKFSVGKQARKAAAENKQTGTFEPCHIVFILGTYRIWIQIVI